MVPKVLLPDHSNHQQSTNQNSAVNLTNANKNKSKRSQKKSQKLLKLEKAKYVLKHRRMKKAADDERRISNDIEHRTNTLTSQLIAEAENSLSQQPDQEYFDTHDEDVDMEDPEQEMSEDQDLKEVEPLTSQRHAEEECNENHDHHLWKRQKRDHDENTEDK